jgi:hypothetical protein
MDQRVIYDKQTGCGGTEYYCKQLFGLFIHLLLPGLEHFLLGQSGKAVILCITSFIFRYVIGAAISGILYYSFASLPSLAGKIAFSIASFLIFSLVFGNEVAIFVDFNQLSYRLAAGYGIGPNEYSVSISTLGLSGVNFLTWLPFKAPSEWIRTSRAIDEQIRRK